LSARSAVASSGHAAPDRPRSGYKRNRSVGINRQALPGIIGAVFGIPRETRLTCGPRMRLDELDPIAEGVENKRPIEALNSL